MPVGYLDSLFTLKCWSLYELRPTACEYFLFNECKTVPDIVTLLVSGKQRFGFYKPKTGSMILRIISELFRTKKEKTANIFRSMSFVTAMSSFLQSIIEVILFY